MAGQALFFANDLDLGFAGASTTYALGYWDEPPEDTLPPTITVVSPTPGVRRGEPGGFPVDDATAQETPVVVNVADPNGTIRYIGVYVSINGGPLLPVYRRGAFQEGFTAYSTVESEDESSLRLSVRRDTGWDLTSMRFVIDAIDSKGNLDV